MADRSLPPVPSPEEETFHRFYNQLLRDINRPVQLAQLLFADGIISSETKEGVTSDADVNQKQALLDAIQHALANNPKKAFQRLIEALRETGLYNLLSDMEKFNSGECTISLQAIAKLRWERLCA